MLDDLEYDDSEPPAIGLVRAGVPWEEVQDHIKIAHHPLLVLPEGSAQYAGVYWTGTKMVVTEDLGSDQEEAISEFRGLLVELGETLYMPFRHIFSQNVANQYKIMFTRRTRVQGSPTAAWIARATECPARYLHITAGLLRPGHCISRP